MLCLKRVVHAFACASLLLVPCTGQGQGAPPKAAEGSAGAPTHRWLDADGNPLPWQGDAQAEEFLAKASIGKATGTSKGVTRPSKITLSRGGLKAHAIFHEVNEEKRFAQLAGGETVTDFRDSYLFQIAAYRIARMVGLQNVPPSVKRSFGGRTGSMTMWVEGMITDEVRRAQNREPAGDDAERWERHMMIMRVWDALIFNFDRNQGNILVDDKWNVWLVDHTRAFRRSTDISKLLGNIGKCERGLFEKMRSLNRSQLDAAVKTYLRPAEIDALLKRRDLIVAQLERLASERGEDRVFFDRP
jgi:hypothetical protein